MVCDRICPTFNALPPGCVGKMKSDRAPFPWTVCAYIPTNIHTPTSNTSVTAPLPRRRYGMPDLNRLGLLEFSHGFLTPSLVFFENVTCRLGERHLSRLKTRHRHLCPAPLSPRHPSRMLPEVASLRPLFPLAGRSSPFRQRLVHSILRELPSSLHWPSLDR